MGWEYSYSGSLFIFNLGTKLLLQLDEMIYYEWQKENNGPHSSSYKKKSCGKCCIPKLINWY